MGDGDGGKKQLEDIDYEFVWAESTVSLLFFPLYELTDNEIIRVMKCRTARKCNVTCTKYILSDTSRNPL